MNTLPVEYAVAASVARKLRSKYHGYVQVEDIQQELYVWLIEHSGTIARWHEEHDNPKTVEKILARSLRNHGEKFCRREKAEYLGYETDDEFFYSIGMVADLLQLHFDPDYMIPGSIQLGQTSSGKPASEGGNLVAMVSDIGRAFNELSEADRDLLEWVYGGNQPVREAINFLAHSWGINYRAASERVRRTVGRLREKLGGARPWEEA